VYDVWLGVGVWGLGRGFQGSGFRSYSLRVSCWNFGLRVSGPRRRVGGFEFRFQGSRLRFRHQGLGFGVKG
jgi:hypothetical protein